jgi:biopolymer transport protein ExbD
VRRRTVRDLPIQAEINVTSLVDIAFTLLVIFIITAPVLQGGVDVNVPRGSVSQVTSNDDLLVLTVDAQGRVFLGETQVDRDELETALPQMLRAADTETVYIKGDSLSAYGPIFQVISTIARVEGVAFALIGEELPDR